MKTKENPLQHAVSLDAGKKRTVSPKSVEAPIAEGANSAINVSETHVPSPKKQKNNDDAIEDLPIVCNNFSVTSGSNANTRITDAIDCSDVQVEYTMFCQDCQT